MRHFRRIHPPAHAEQPAQSTLPDNDHRQSTAEAITQHNQMSGQLNFRRFQYGGVDDIVRAQWLRRDVETCAVRRQRRGFFLWCGNETPPSCGHQNLPDGSGRRASTASDSVDGKTFILDTVRGSDPAKSITSSTTLALVSACRHTDASAFLVSVCRSRLRFFSTMMRSTPSAARRSAQTGLLSFFGCWPMYRRCTR